MSDKIIDIKKARARKVGKRRQPPKPNGASLVNGKADTGEIVPVLEQMNRVFAVVALGNQARVFNPRGTPLPDGSGYVPAYYSFANFCHLLNRERVVVPDHRGNDKRIGKGSWWLDQEGRMQYDGVVYSPRKPAPDGFLNLWTGFGIEDEQGDWSLYCAHLLDNVCQGSEFIFEYVLDWMANAVQNPGEQGHVTIAMRGREGTGKGMVAKPFQRIFGQHYRYISSPAHLVGNFNAHLHQCSFLFADEALFAGDRKVEGVLKALNTEPLLTIEQKGVDAFQAANCLHIMMASNSDWVLPAGADARRYLVLDISDAQMQNHEYVAALDNEIMTGGAEALLYDLLQRDLSEFNPRKVPHTEALAEQKAFTRRGVDALIEQICDDGVLPAAHPLNPHVALTTGEAKGEGFYVAAKALVPDLKYLSSVKLRRQLAKDWACTSWRDRSQRGVEFPSLSELRALFDARHGPQDWDVLPEWVCDTSE